MSKRMTSETIIFDTDWLTEADFEDGQASIRINYQAYDTLKIMVPSNYTNLNYGGLFQEFDVYKLDNFGPAYQILLEENDSGFIIEHTKNEGYFDIYFMLEEDHWQDFLKGRRSIYIKGVKR